MMRNRLLLLNFIKALGIGFLLTASATVNAADTRRLVFAVDGLSYDAFQVAQERGLFKSFVHSGRHVSPYPSMTEPSWTEIMDGKSLFQRQGNIKTIEAAYFDIDSMTLMNDTRNVFNRAANDYSFYRAFDYYFNPYLEGLMYFPNESLLQMEMDQLEKEVQAGFTGSHYIAYISSVDATAHTQKDKLFPVLEKLSATLEKIVAEQKSKSPSLQAWIISDHGNEGAFAEGEIESYLKPVSLDSAAKKAGLEIVQGTLTHPGQISIPIMALGNMGNVYFKDLSKRRAFALEAIKSPGVDLVTYDNVGTSERFISILGTTTEARLYWSTQGYAYQSIQGNPLELPIQLVSGSGSLKWISDAEMFGALAGAKYPDAPFRLVRSALKEVENVPDLIVTLKAGYCFKGDFTKFVQMVRTHGSLSAHSSLGIVASTKTSIPEQIRSRDIMKLVGISPAESFHSVEDLFHKDPEKVIQQLEEQEQKGIPTRVMELSGDLIFRRINKVLASTIDFLPAEEFQTFADGIKLFASSKSESTHKADSLADTLKKVDPKKLLQNVDRFFALKDIAVSTQDPTLLANRLWSQLSLIPGMPPVSELDSSLPVDSDSKNMNTGINLFRRLVMKTYELPFLVNEWLNIPEFDVVPDTRNLAFAKNWFAGVKTEIRSAPGQVNDDKALASHLFSEIFEERKLKKTLSPATFPLLYNPASKNITVVFVPGIYNELFDHEIFSRGLRALREELGLRVLYVDVDGRCTTTRNATVIYDKLREDTRQREARGYPTPQYLIFGYSKGGVDATESLLVDPAFTRSQIAGLVSIASPHRGTSILDNMDLPSLVSEKMVSRPIPAECKKEPGSESVRRGPRSAFWAKNLPQLVDLTRFYSVSFATDIEHAHPWMKISKNIARFQTPNDGVVTVESSKFPAALNPVDLGILDADHLAGILASSFPQGPFLESIVLTLLELNALSSDNLKKWFEAISKSSPYLVVDNYKRELSAHILRASESGTASALMNTVGPFPDADVKATGVRSDEAFDWYKGIAQEREMLHTHLRCLGDAEYSSILLTLSRLTRGSPFALKPVSMTCSSEQKVLVTITKKARSYYRFWETPVTETFTVDTLEDLATLFLSSALESGKNFIESAADSVNLPKSNRKAITLPANTLNWGIEKMLDLKSFNKTLEASQIQPMLPAAYPIGFGIYCDQPTMKEFRKEYQFQYESASPSGVDDNPSGFMPVLQKEAKDEFVACRMRSDNNSIRLTSAALRFKPIDFQNLDLKIKVTRGPVGADSAIRGSGKDDSAFQVWFTLRNNAALPDRSKFTSDAGVIILGYYWAEDATVGSLLAPGDLIENYYSNKNMFVVTLPEAWQFVLDAGKTALGPWKEFHRNIAEDIQKAFPHQKLEDLEVVGVTFQSDSNDTKTSSEAYFREMRFSPK